MMIRNFGSVSQSSFSLGGAVKPTIETCKNFGHWIIASDSGEERTSKQKVVSWFYQLCGGKDQPASQPWDSQRVFLVAQRVGLLLLGIASVAACGAGMIELYQFLQPGLVASDKLSTGFTAMQLDKLLKLERVFVSDGLVFWVHEGEVLTLGKLTEVAVAALNYLKTT